MFFFSDSGPVGAVGPAGAVGPEVPVYVHIGFCAAFREDQSELSIKKTNNT